jgi:hypothetical protein
LEKQRLGVGFSDHNLKLYGLLAVHLRNVVDKTLLGNYDNYSLSITRPLQRQSFGKKN